MTPDEAIRTALFACGIEGSEKVEVPEVLHQLGQAGYALVRRVPVPVHLDDSAELDALPVGAILFDSDCDVIVRAFEGWRYWGDESDFTEDAIVCLPAFVMHDPKTDLT